MLIGLSCLNLDYDSTLTLLIEINTSIIADILIVERFKVPYSCIQNACILLKSRSFQAAHNCHFQLIIFSKITFFLTKSFGICPQFALNVPLGILSKSGVLFSLCADTVIMKNHLELEKPSRKRMKGTNASMGGQTLAS